MYQPDAWVIVHIETGSGIVLDKVMGGWYGGYLGADEWRLNSGIAGISFNLAANAYEFVGSSGSVYQCHKENERATMLMAGVIASMDKAAQDDGGSVTIIPVADARVYV